MYPYHNRRKVSLTSFGILEDIYRANYIQEQTVFALLELRPRIREQISFGTEGFDRLKKPWCKELRTDITKRSIKNLCTVDEWRCWISKAKVTYGRSSVTDVREVVVCSGFLRMVSELAQLRLAKAMIVLRSAQWHGIENTRGRL